MIRHIQTRRRLFAAAALAAVALGAAACNVKKELLEPQNPSIIGPDQVQSPTAADALRKGVYNRLRSTTASIVGSFGSNWAETGVLTDEWKSANTFSQHQEVDSRSIALN